MRRFIHAGAIVLVGVLVVAGALVALGILTGPRGFVREWSRRLPDSRPPRSVGSTTLADGVFVRRFPDGSWVAAKVEGSCQCANGRFEAAVFADDSGNVYYETTFGFHGDPGAMGALEADSAAEFRQRLESEFDLELRPAG